MPEPDAVDLLRAARREALLKMALPSESCGEPYLKGIVRVGEYLVATDMHLLAAMPALSGEDAPSLPSKVGQDMHNHIMRALLYRGEWASWIPMLPMPEPDVVNLLAPCPDCEGEECGECEGSGEHECTCGNSHTCAACQGTGHKHGVECDTCHGRRSVPVSKPSSVIYGDQRFSYEIVKKLTDNFPEARIKPGIMIEPAMWSAGYAFGVMACMPRRSAEEG